MKNLNKLFSFAVIKILLISSVVNINLINHHIPNQTNFQNSFVYYQNDFKLITFDKKIETKLEIPTIGEEFGLLDNVLNNNLLEKKQIDELFNVKLTEKEGFEILNKIKTFRNIYNGLTYNNLFLYSGIKNSKNKYFEIINILKYVVSAIGVAIGVLTVIASAFSIFTAGVSLAVLGIIIGALAVVAGIIGIIIIALEQNNSNVINRLYDAKIKLTDIRNKYGWIVNSHLSNIIKKINDSINILTVKKPSPIYNLPYVPPFKQGECHGGMRTSPIPEYCFYTQPIIDLTQWKDY